MKKLFLIPVLGMLFASCVKDAGTTTPETPQAPVATNYLTVSLVAANRAGTRVEVNEKDYQDGTASENAVTMVRFFFFDASGNAVAVWKLKGTSNYESFIDWYPSDSEFGGREPEETVERIVHTTLGINSLSDDEMPAAVLAVINPNAAVLALGNESKTIEGEVMLYGPSLTQLRGVVADFKTGLTESNFVMSNSVYVDKNDEVVDTTALTEANFAASVEEAEANAVVIYVERVVARLDLTMGLEAAEGKTAKNGKPMYPTKPEEGTYTVDDEDVKIYVTLLGWNITNDTRESRLMKNISASWPNDTFFGNATPWNISDLHRSFWAINPAGFTYPDSYLFGMFNDGKDTNVNPATQLAMPDADNPTVTVYLQENAGAGAALADAAAAYPTKVIIAAQLVDETGEPLSLAEWAYKKYTLESLKDHFADNVLARLYKKSTLTSGSTDYKKIEPEDLDFKTGAELFGEEVPEGEGSYYVYVVLAKASENADWQLKGDDGYTAMSLEEVNNYLRDRINHVMVWNNGYTYYYFDIRHLGAKENPGYVGVVRNHLYEANIRSLTGLGTPVYNPDEEIYPEMPEYDESIVSATIKILQWRIVSQQYDLEWK